MKLKILLSFILLCALSSICLSQDISISQDIEAQVLFEFSEIVIPSNDPRELAVAFHSITFIDSVGHSLGELIFGTAEANALQGDGWFANEVWPNIGPFQWAGGSSKKSSIQLSIPDGTEGILLYIISIKDNLWMNVKIDDELATTLRVDAYWHQGYIPIGESIPESFPPDEPEWIDGYYFPRFPSTDRIYAIKVRNTLAEDYAGAWQPDWRINNSPNDMMALTLVGMQGIINRSKPRVYLDWNDPDGNTSFWLPYLEDHVEVIYLNLDGLSAVNFLMRRYGPRFSGAVIYDPDVPETVNLATMIAGLEDRIILAPEQVNLPGMPTFESAMDLRSLVQEQGWTATTEGQYDLYQWVYDNLWPRLEHRIIGIISPGPPTSGPPYGVLNQFWPFGMASRDYIVALRLPALYLSPIDDPQRELFTRYLEDAPSPIPIYGFVSKYEYGTVSLASQYGDWVASITNPGQPITAGNISVFSGVRPKIKPYLQNIDEGRIFATLEDKPVVSMWCTDGDNIQYLMDRGFHPFFIWEDIQNQHFGWTTNPTLANLAPLIWNYYLDSRSEVSLIMGLSGAGYTYPQLMSNTQLDNYLTYTARYMGETGLHVVRVNTPNGSWDENLASHYYDGLRHSGYLGAIVGYGGSRWGLGFDFTGVPAPTVRPSYTLKSKNWDWIIDDLISRKAGEDIIDIIYNWMIREGDFVNDNDALGGQAVLFPGEAGTNPYLAIMTGPIALAAGNYTVNFRMKVSDNQANEHFIALYVGASALDWRFIEHQSLAPSDFQQTGQYQDFTLHFTLDQLTPDIEFRIDHFNSSTDFYVDYIHFKREDELNMPVFASMIIGLIIPPEETIDLNVAPGKFTRDFEIAGGIVLTPDEFLAALNPKYMYDLALPVLGSEHAALKLAQQQFLSGQYLNSLLTVRNALRTRIAQDLLIFPEQTTIEANCICSIDIIIEGVTNLAGYQFDMIFDPTILQADSVLTGTFLGSTGRKVSVIGPSINNDIGKVIITVFSSGTNSGPDGSGTLATLFFTASSAGTSTLQIQNINLRNAHNKNLTAGRIGTGQITVKNPSGIEQDGIYPKQFSLRHNYPNPFNPSTNIKFDLPQAADVKIEIFNIMGQKVSTLISRHMPAGYHQVEFDAQNLSSGIFFYRIKAGEYQDVKKMVLLR